MMKNYTFKCYIGKIEIVAGDYPTAFHRAGRCIKQKLTGTHTVITPDKLWLSCIDIKKYIKGES